MSTVPAEALEPSHDLVGCRPAAFSDAPLAAQLTGPRKQSQRSACH